MSTFLPIAGSYLVAAAMPGPNFFMISQLALDGNRREARPSRRAWFAINRTRRFRRG
jgi:threonine/homoserine/homoserine lactone efflux protein